ncbi:ATP-binding protein [Algoriphagus mannitolivorans]|uniref:ATP-binding protein n=1 Tax=Algoriphagus mannitolivorans TaxID=226504 RepID=UPI0003FD3842|nr:ATP-binding protein [Algoriphagus mannitolivorans]
MKISSSLKQEILTLMEDYWKSYFEGNLEKWANYLPEFYKNIGTTQEEIWNSKQDIVDYTHRVKDQMVGMADIKNKTVQIIPYDPYFMVHELGDLYVKSEKEWVFYAHFRLSSLLEKTTQGWKILHQHGSFPDHKATEGEAFGLEAVKAENERLKKAVEERTAELENKNRELLVESALERVRTVAMSMKKPDDMLEVCRVISDELTQFGIDGIRNVQTVIIQEEKEIYLCYQYFPAYNQEIIERTEYLKNPVEKELVDKISKAKDGYFEGSLKGKVLDEFRQHRKEEKHLEDPLMDQVDEIHYFFYSIGQGALGITLYQALNFEGLSIFKRFHQVFSFAYSRFKDLEKAVAQAREARIEAALERVRSRSIAMHKSEELSDLSLELVKQVQALGMETWFCAFNIYDDDKKGSLEWGSNGLGVFPKYRTPREGIFLRYYKAGQKGETLLVNEIGEDECPAHYEYLCSLPGVGEQLLKMKADGIPFPASQIDHVAFFKYGYIIFITYKPVPESHEVFKRFAKVFEQTYTRFLDLQRAEAQTRKSEIEVAVERVRAQSMAMHHPDDLNKVNKELLSQLQWLQVKGLSGVTFYLVEENGWVKAWDFSSPGNIGNQNSYTFQFDSNKHEMLGFPFKILENTDLDYFIADYPLEKLKKALPELEEIDPAVAKIFTEAIETGVLTHQWTACARISSGMLGVDLTAPPSEDTKTIVLKMAGAFNQAYTRFLDLQKAEAQAREAQIESALERVRSRSMAMHNSNEIGDVAMVLFQQLKSLGGELWGTGFAFCEKNSELDEFWFANENGIMPHLKIPNNVDPAHKQMYEGWNKNLEFLSIENGGKELKAHYKYMLTVPDVQPIFQGILDQGIEFPKWQKWHAAYFKYGYMLVITTETYEDEKVFTRFARAFEQAYTRFLDLQKAEAQAREAQIEAALERVRSRTMGMQKAAELGDVAQLLFGELNGLVDDLWTCGFVLCEKDRQEDEWWLSLDNGLIQPFSLPNVGDFAHENLYEGWQKQESYRTVTLENQDLQKHYDWLMELPIAKKIFEDMEAAGIPRPKWQRLHAAYFKTGYLVIITEVPCSEEEIFRRFAQVFDQTYTRFLDLQKAEAQAREAQINLAVERVRARALAMNKSEQILDVVFKLKEELMGLDISGVAAATILLKESDGKVRSWDLTSMEKEGDQMHIASDIIFDLGKTHPDFYQREIWAKGNTYQVVTQDRESLQISTNWLRDHGKFKEAEEAEKFIASAGIKKVYHPSAPLAKGRMVIDLLESPQEEVKSILTKMAAAFDLAYKRFEDLQMAESQAKEAKIELSLERIRSLVTSMQESNELFDVVVAMRKEFVSLGHQAHYFWHMKWSTEAYDMSMTSEEGDRIGMIISVPKFVHDKIPSLASWEKSDSPVFVLDLDGSQAWDYIENMNKYGHYELADPKSPSEEDILALGGLTFVIARTTHGEIGFSLPGKIPNPPEESLHTLIRFAKVFGIAYKRFEDLQYAEAQAKEAQIELSLERIRSKVTSMQESTDLLDIMVSIRSEFVSLGHQAQYFWYMRWLTSKYEKAMTSGDGAQVGMVMTLPRHIHRDIPLVANWERGNEPTLIFPMDVDTAMDYVQKMVSLGDFEKVDPNAPTMDDIRHIGGLTFIMAKTSQGEIGYSLPGYVPNPPEEAVSTLARFAGVFDLAYKRFEDLKKAEKDLIEIKLAKQKAEKALSELKSAQAQLIQSEKMASLGELTAGIAHEIQNPLNFVNNFSEVSGELIDEAQEEIEKGDLEEIKFILQDLKDNLSKINHHGKRAGSIVKGMLEHSRKSEGKKEQVNLNGIADECLKLSFHGLRAKDKSFSADFKTHFAEDLPEVSVVRQDIGRVLLNLINNAFYAVHDFGKTQDKGYKPTVTVSTSQVKDQIEITVSDNGKGIPEQIQDKIFQPFFTTKPTGEGTGLGLSLSYDIIKAHGGSIALSSSPGQGAAFTITLPKK